jgi:tRNA (guanine-N7-)-methyltransferase
MSIALRTVRSFVRRNGRLSTNQRYALQHLAADYVLEHSHNLDLPTIFGRDAPQHLEIGFGGGENLLALAQHYPQHNFFGIEVYLAGIANVLLQIQELNLTNIRLCYADVVQFLPQLRPNSLDYVYIFFPDPWHKTRHHKRRLLQPAFMAQLIPKLTTDAKLYVATDWPDYAQQIQQLLEAEPALINLAGKGNYALRFALRPLTKFERRAQRLGHGIWDFNYQKTSNYAKS